MALRPSPPALRCSHAGRAAHAAAAARLVPPPWRSKPPQPARPSLPARSAHVACAASATDGAAAAAEDGSAEDDPALMEELRDLLLEPSRLLRAVATVSASRPRPPPSRKRLELRPVRVRGAVRLSAEALVGTQAFASNHDFNDDGREGAAAAVAAALAERFDNWRVETRDVTLTLTRNRRGALAASRAPAVRIAPPAAPGAARADALAHDRVKPRLLPADDPLFVALGISSPDGRLKAAKADKYIQARCFEWRLLAQHAVCLLTLSLRAARRWRSSCAYWMALWRTHAPAGGCLPPRARARCASWTSAAATRTSRSPRTRSWPSSRARPPRLSASVREVT